MKWLELALLSTFFLAAVTLGFKFILARGVKEMVLFFYTFLFGTILFGAYLLIKKQPLGIDRVSLIVILAVAVIAVVGNYLMAAAINAAPNPGYVSGINALQIVIVTVAAVFLFKSEFTAVKAAGIGLALIGVFLLGR